MNPRFSGGLTRLASAAPDLHLDLLQLNALIGRDVGRPAADIEAAGAGSRSTSTASSTRWGCRLPSTGRAKRRTSEWR